MTKETKIQSFSIKWIIGLGIASIIIGLLVLSSQENDKQTINQKSESSSSRHLSGIFKLPADGTVVDKDVNGQELWYRKGEYVRFQQLGSPEKFTVVNERPTHQSWTTSRRVVSSGQSKYSDKIQLMAADGKNITVQVRIIPGRS